MHASRRASLLGTLTLLACQSDRATAPAHGAIPDSPAPSVAFATCDGCAFGPATYVQETNKPTTYTNTFATTSRMTYRLDIDDLGSKGANESVQINGLTFQRERQAGEDGPRARHLMIAGLPNPSTIVVTQLGKKKSQLVVSLRAALRLTSVTMSSNTLAIGGPFVDYSASILSNSTGVTLTGVSLQNWIEQGTARRAASGSIVNCGLAGGSIAPGTCVMPFGAGANTTTADGTGTLVPGPATLVVQLLQSTSGPDVLYDEERIPITLAGPPSITSIVFSTTNIVLEANGTPYDVTFQNFTGANVTGVFYQGEITQGTAVFAAGGSSVFCPTVEGVLPTGTCTNSFTARASNSLSGSGGPLVAGPATFVLTLYQVVGSDPPIVLDQRSVPITLMANP